MEGFRRLLIVAVAVVLAAATAAEGRLVYVGGGKTTWAANVNFTEWSSHQHFYVGDWIYFGFDKHTYNVLEVNKTSYETCNDVGFIKNITRGGRDVYQLTEAKTYYFLSGRGFCYGGLKVAIPVENIPPAASPAPSPANKNSAASTPSPLSAARFIGLGLLTASALSTAMF
ncbi:unnamed protein product [Linum tenue]|uniref:Phytocyanin domain-containing protein n=1 Tax=Linum tenue TaxID=586396 RepID=A0AAV0N158_9ROSI|nr:unnamed protein product [Linum tenue]